MQHLRRPLLLLLLASLAAAPLLAQDELIRVKAEFSRNTAPAPGGEYNNQHKRRLFEAVSQLRRSRGDMADATVALGRLADALEAINGEFVDKLSTSRWDALIGKAVAELPRIHDEQKGDWDKISDRLVATIIGELGDLHSAMLEPRAWKELLEDTRQSFFGVGMELLRPPLRDLGTGELMPNNRGPVKVVLAFTNNPAANAGVEDDDLIVAVDGVPVDEMPLDDVVARIKGPKGSFVTLSLLRGGTAIPPVRVQRGEIRPVSAYSKWLDQGAGLGYLRIAHFNEPTFAEFVAAVERLRAQGLQDLVIDLRGNPGGLLRGVADVASEFLDKGKLIYTVEQQGLWREKGAAKTQGKFAGLRVVLLVNEGSASSSEILAGALRDQIGAKIVGVTTFGKGSAQTLIPLDQERGMKVTSGRWKTPAGTSIDIPRDPKTGRKLAGAVGGIAPDPDLTVEMSPEWESDLLREINREMYGKLPGGITVPDPVLKKARELLAPQPAAAGR